MVEFILQQEIERAGPAPFLGDHREAAIPGRQTLRQLAETGEGEAAGMPEGGMLDELLRRISQQELADLRNP